MEVFVISLIGVSYATFLAVLVIWPWNHVQTWLAAGKVVLEAVILTSAVVVGLTLYTFWAARRGYDFNFLGPFLFSAIIVLVVFGFIQVLIPIPSADSYLFLLGFWLCMFVIFVYVQVLFPLGKTSVMIYGCLGAIIFCAYIVYDTDNLIKRYTYDAYIWAAVALYLDIINLFLSLLTIFRAADAR